jgi:hypothetical protein
MVILRVLYRKIVLNCRVHITDEFWRTRSWPIISRILMSAGNIPRKFGKPTEVNISGIFCNYCSGIFMHGTEENHQ